MRNCFVTGCDNYCKQNNMTPRKMFLPPKEMVEKWANVVKNNKRSLNKSDRVCERHFESNDIIEFWENNIQGRIHLTPRDKPKLRESAVPSKNLSPISSKNVDKHSAAITQKRKFTKGPRDYSIKESKILKLIDSNDDIIDQLDVEIPEDAAILFSQSTNAGQIVLKNPDESNSKKLLDYENSSLLFQPVLLSEENRVKNLAAFETLYDEAFDVELPNLLWGIHRDPEKRFIAFTEFNQQHMNMSKVFIVYETLHYEMKTNGITKFQGYLKNVEDLTEEISSMLDDKNFDSSVV